MSEFVLSHPSGLRISASLSESDAAPISQSRKDIGNGWVWYQLPRFEDEGALIGVSLGFCHGKLEQVTLFDAHPRFGRSWSDWSEASERRRAESIGSWLSLKGFHQGTHAWGSVWAGYDPKGGAGSAVVRLAI